MRQLKITKSITNRESASLDKYLQEIGREELVSPEEEVELSQRIRKGDQKALGKFEQENERQPSTDELADMIDIPKDKIADTLRVSGRHVSVDAPFVEGEDNSLLDVLPNDDSPSADRGLTNESLSTEIERALQILTPREREIIKSFFGIGCQEMTLEEIGERLDLTRERVRQIKEKAIRKLKKPSASKLLKTYLG